MLKVKESMSVSHGSASQESEKCWDELENAAELKAEKRTKMWLLF